MSVTKVAAEFLPKDRHGTKYTSPCPPPLPYYLTLARSKNPPSRPPRSAFSTPSIPRQPVEWGSNKAFQFLPRRSFPSLLFLLPSRHLSTSFRRSGAFSEPPPLRPDRFPRIHRTLLFFLPEQGKQKRSVGVGQRLVHWTAAALDN